MGKMTIKFLAPSKHVLEVRERPQPASAFLPQWWRDMPPYSTGKFELKPGPTVTAKKCFPLLDGMTSGYIVPLWADIMVTKVNDYMQINWLTTEPVVEAWNVQQSANYELPKDCGLPVFKYLHGWIPITPPGYSCLITHPFAYPNLPFKTLTGVVDTDKLKTYASSPFVLKKDFEGIIEKGTPMFQIIPFKRDEWEMEIAEQNPEEFALESEKFFTRMISSYGRTSRSKKSFS